MTEIIFKYPAPHQHSRHTDMDAFPTIHISLRGKWKVSESRFMRENEFHKQMKVIYKLTSESLKKVPSHIPAGCLKVGEWGQSLDL